MHTFEELLSTFEESLETISLKKEPKLLYEPIEYLLGAGGKRIRPVMVLMSHNLFSDNINDSINAAIAVELFHNFTLLHDDIMDNANIRRGRATVNNKWTDNVAILSGDTMTIMAYQYIIKTPEQYLTRIMPVFNKFAIEICEGQRYDMDYEQKSSVTKSEYIEMIRLKTSVLLAGAMEIGAIIGGASEEITKKLYEFGENIGLAFQLTDDMLDTYGNSKTFGKEIGGDIIEGKKTYLYISTLENAEIDKHDEIIDLFNSTSLSKNEKIKKVKKCYDKYNAKEAIKEGIQYYYSKAKDILDSVNLPEEKKKYFYKFAKQLIEREK